MLTFNSLGMSALLSSLNHISNFDSRPLMSNVVDYTQNPLSQLKLHHQISMVKTVTPKLDLICSSQRVSPIGELLTDVDNGEVSDAGEHDQSKVSFDSSEKTILNNGNTVFSCIGSVETMDSKMLTERIRRIRIGLANKGKVPWNKGRRHTAETRERIKQRTQEALRDPKVRAKMSEHPLKHSDQIKAKIGSSQKRLWKKRLKSKRLKEQLYFSWAKSIADGARKGGSDEEELDWDSYDKIQQQLDQQQLDHQHRLWAHQKRIAEHIAVARVKKFMDLWATSIAKAAKNGGKGEQELDWDSYDKIQQQLDHQHQLWAHQKRIAKHTVARVKKFMDLWATSIAKAAKNGGKDEQELDWDSYDKIHQQLHHQHRLWAHQKRIAKHTAVARVKKFMDLWATSIAKAARNGGKDEQELDWDSYEKIQEEMAVRYRLQKSAEKVKAKEMARIRADRAAKINTIKKTMLMQKKREHEERAKAVNSDLQVLLDFKLNSKLKFSLRENTRDQEDREGKASDSIFPNSKKLDLEFIKEEKLRKEVSLRDQIRDAKNKRGKIH